MVIYRPFKAIRPAEALADKIATLPYDVLNSDEARVLAADNEFSYLHIDKAEVNVPLSVDVHSQAIYDEARAQLTDFLSKGWLKKEPTAAYYLYELTLNGRMQTGIVGCASISDYENGTVKRHEFTLPEKELDRVNHSLACDGNTSPIFLTYRKNKELSALTESWKAKHLPIYDFVSFYGVQHRVWLMNESAISQRIAEIFVADIPALYIADGHHRTASAVRVGQKYREKFGNRPDAEYNFFLSVAFPDDELEILDYNRVVTTPLPENFWQQVEKKFDINPVEKSKPKHTHVIHAVTVNGWCELVPKPDIIPTDEVASLDVSLLQDNILAPLLEIDDPKTSPAISFVGGIRGLDALEEAVKKGASIGFALYPPTMSALLAVADAGKIMPPKSTWFEPKLLSGLFLHDLET